MKEARLAILKLVAKGRITAEEAEPILARLKDTPPSTTAPLPYAPFTAPSLQPTWKPPWGEITCCAADTDTASFGIIGIS